MSSLAFDAVLVAMKSDKVTGWYVLDRYWTDKTILILVLDDKDHRYDHSGRQNHVSALTTAMDAKPPDRASSAKRCAPAGGGTRE